MNPQDLEKLKSFCEDFKSYRDNTVDGNGNNLHDIKNSFDYVRKTLETYQLSGTTFGTELASKAGQASNVLSELWRCYANLEKAIDGFVTEQSNRNSQAVKG